MCGLVGIVGSGAAGHEILGDMRDTLCHRGPDDSGVYFDRRPSLRGAQVGWIQASAHHTRRVHPALLVCRRIAAPCVSSELRELHSNVARAPRKTKRAAELFGCPEIKAALVLARGRLLRPESADNPEAGHRHAEDG